VLDHKGEERRGCGSRLDQRERTFRYSTVKDPLGGSTDKERRGRGEGAHYSYGEGNLRQTKMAKLVGF
jgi:hypothetical protein